MPGSATKAEASQPVPLHDDRHRILSALFDAHCLLDLRPQFDDQSFQTAIIELVPEQGYLVLDELKPNEVDIMRAGSPRVNLKSKIRGLEVRFESVITQRGKDDGVMYYKALYPDSVEYPQRRREYRVTVPMTKGIAMRWRAHTEAGDEVEVRGDIRDLSPSGFSATLDVGGVAMLKQLDHPIGRCEIHLDDDSIALATVEVCHIFSGDRDHVPKLGACFIDLDAPTERLIERFVAQLDREQARLR